MLNQFRIQYPQGSLISELLTINHKQYVVKVLIQVNGVILATGLGGAETVEQAEDKARTRALELLNLNSTPVIRVIPDKNDKQLDELSRVNQTEASNQPSVDSVSEIKSEPVVSLSSQNPSVSQVNQSTNGVDLKALTGTESVLMSTEEFDLVIAKTEIEMKRIKWSKEQGREFLTSKFGKKTRNMLSDSELLEFLAYLQSQPTPSS